MPFDSEYYAKLYGAPPMRRRFFGPSEAASIVGGLSARPSMPGFWGGLSAGLAGSLGGAAQYAAGTHQQERDALEQMMKERQYKLQLDQLNETIRHNQAQEARAAEQKATQEELPGVIPQGTYGPLAPGEVYAPPDLPPSSWKSFFNSKAAALGGEAGRSAKPTPQKKLSAFEEKVQAIMFAEKVDRQAAIRKALGGKPPVPPHGTMRIGPSFFKVGKMDTTYTYPIPAVSGLDEFVR